MQIPIHQVDAFADRPFTGNPAAVCPLVEPIPAEVMQAIAAENNLAETAFLVPREPSRGDGAPAFDLRWFTPLVEVDLCGHATLASGHVVLNEINPDAESVTFHTRSGPLEVAKDLGGRLRMDLPADPRRPTDAPEELISAIGSEPDEVLGGSTWIAVMPDRVDIAALRPDIAAIGRLEIPYLVVTGQGPGDPHTGPAFVSRFFAPGAGIDEDPVTGSAHCALLPYWSERLGRTRLDARQVSARGGDLDCELLDDRVVLRGGCVEVLKGTLSF